HPTTNQKNQPATREATSPNYHNPHNQTNPENVNHNNQEASLPEMSFETRSRSRGNGLIA
ncbi:hypothetical protein, partial [uncultured Actinobaculum sp.]|uniref:hypothetical protein n=1 Tax=uncultured Actinobaculum sp. TaxID=655643 RepID=UPI00280550E7